MLLRGSLSPAPHSSTQTISLPGKPPRTPHLPAAEAGARSTALAHGGRLKPPARRRRAQRLRQVPPASRAARSPHSDWTSSWAALFKPPLTTRTQPQPSSPSPEHAAAAPRQDSFTLLALQSTRKSVVNKNRAKPQALSALNTSALSPTPPNSFSPPPAHT